MPELAEAPAAPASEGEAAPLLRVRGLAKAFGGTQALRGVDLEIRAGEVHGLIGQNGSGKSTLIKVLCGYHAPDAGSVEIRGEEVRLPIRPGEARRLGLSFVHQDLTLAEGMTVLENLRLGRYDTTAYGRVRWRRERALVRRSLGAAGLELDPDTPIRQVPQAERALLGFLRAAHDVEDEARPGVLVLDEPTASLPAPSVAQLFAAARRLAGRGCGVVFVSHRLQEVLDVCDRISVIRDGRLVAHLERAEATEERLIALMLGRELGQLYPSKPRPRSDAVLAAEDLSGRVAHGVSLDVHRGEIVGVTGLVGMGHDELPYLIYGAADAASGRVSVDGRTVEPRSPAALRRAGVALLPADRPRRSGTLGASVLENVTLPVTGEFFRAGRLRRGRERARVLELLTQFDVRPPDPSARLGALSGGNQQKALLAKWLQVRPRVLLLHEPTQGVDVGSRKQIFSIIRQVAEDGTAVLIASAEYADLANLCNRVLVMRRGTVGTELSGADLREERIVEQCYVSR